MKLQITFNSTDLDEALRVALLVSPHTDTLILGTLLMQEAGILAVKKFKQAFPDHTVAVDAKVCDRAGQAITHLAQAGADAVSVLAGTSNDTIFQAVQAAQKYTIKITLDLLDAFSLGQSAMDGQHIGVDSLLFRRLHDASQGENLLDQWETTRGNTKLPIYIVGNINRSTIHRIIHLQPNGIIIGSAIVNANDPAAEAEYFATLVSNQ